MVYLSLRATGAILETRGLNITVLSGAMQTFLVIFPTSQRGEEGRLLLLVPLPGVPLTINSKVRVVMTVVKITIR